MEKSMIRALKADEIECRACTVNEKGLSLLLYKDARVDQKILDETFGAFGWKRSHQCIGGGIYCTVEILDKESGQWVSKQDVGTAGSAEKEKSQASDSFKRACFNWGIGRELYTAPFIWIPAGKAEIQWKAGPGQEKRYYCNERFYVSDIQYNRNREIMALSIVNGKGQAVYTMGIGGSKAAVGSQREDTAGGGKRKAANGGLQGKIVQKGPGKELQGMPISKGQMKLLQEELDRTGVTMETVKGRYKIQEPCAMGEELYGKVMSALKRTKSASVA